MVETIYFGGGSPSFISLENLGLILNKVRSNFSVKKDAEITIECNPDDIDYSFVKGIKSFGFNRISLGIQSFFDDDLKLMNRAHNTNQAEESVRLLKDSGLENITIDLIYGLPNSTIEKWQENISKALKLDVPHISSYCLTIEENTFLKHQIDKGIVEEIGPESQLEQFKILVDKLIESGYEHYEISNFAKNGFRSKHNSSYWRNKDYIGIGPSAHSKIGNKRFWNIANNAQYVKLLNQKEEISEQEILTEQDQFNERLMIGLRTKEGVNLQELKAFSQFDSDFQNQLQKLQIEGRILLDKETIRIEGANKFIADTIISDLFIV